MKTSVYHDYTMGSAFKRILGLLLAAVMLTGTLTPALAYVPPVAQEPAAIAATFPDGFSEDRTKYEIYPMPHDVQYLTQNEFQVTPRVNVVAETGIDTYTKAFLEELLTKYGKTFHYSAEVVEGETNFLLGVKGSGGVADSYATAHAPLKKPALFDQIDPYLLRAESDQNPNGIITIVGKDTDSAYYGVATLQMMFSSFAGKRFLPVQIEDYSNVIYRGFIEGFYGVYADPYPFRESQMRSIRDVKGNTYVFAAKGDAYHGSKWAELYPKEELAQIKHLVEVGLETKVAYTWSVHLGQGGFFRGITGKNPNDPTYRDRVEKLKAKFQQLYDVGVRGFHILNDDANSGTHEQVVMLLNEMNAWRKEKGCRPIIYCCNGYNTAWAGNGAELTALKALDSDIYLYWTGSDVNSPITQASVDWPRAKSNHYPVTWLNYPCSEHAGSVPLLGNSLYYLKNADNLQNHMGIISNPVRSQSETTKIAFFQLLSWGWNRDNY
ncbi:MAG: beta-N-acetylglucosaminidase domain-containing protein, partial [Pseudoflavonifractor sp.]